jgi:NTP pyrophosphatase (non-canonical NTP hydrolase)
VNVNVEVILLEILLQVRDERRRQDEKFGWFENPDSLLPNGSEEKRLAVLAEEFGEVARAVLERGFAESKDDHERWEANLEEELIQVAAVAIAWLEARRQRAAGLDREHA